MLNAIHHNDIMKIKGMLESGVDPNQEINGTLPLHCAIIENRLSVIALLVEFGANIQALNSERKSPLRVAVDLEKMNCIRLLLSLGANPNEMCICLQKDFFITYSEEKFYANEDSYDFQDNMHPLFHVVCLTGNLSIVKAFVGAGVNVNIESVHSNRYVLDIYYDCQKIPLDILKYLIENGININHRNEQGNPIAFSRFARRDVEAGQMLIRAGAIINFKYDCGETSCNVATTIIQDEDLVLLCREGLDVNAVGRKGKTMLHVAVDMNRFETVKEILQTFQNINARTDSGNTALSYCAWYIRMVVLLISAGIDVDSKDNNGCSSYAFKNDIPTPPLRILCFRQLRREMMLDDIVRLIHGPCVALSTNKTISL